MGQILGMLSLNFFADRFGRKPALYLLWVVLVAVRFVCPSFSRTSAADPHPSCVFLLVQSIFAETFAGAWWAWLIAKLLAGRSTRRIRSSLPD